MHVYRGALYAVQVQRLEGWGEKVTVVYDGEGDPEFLALVDKAIEVGVAPPSAEGLEGAGAPQSQDMASMVVPARFTDLAGLHLSPTAAQQDEYTEPAIASRSRNEVMMSHTLAGHELRPSASMPLAVPTKAPKRDSTLIPGIILESESRHEERIKPTLYKAERLNDGEDEDLAWSWDKIGVYDADDLAAEDMYFLHVANGISYLWLGEGFEPPRANEDEPNREDAVRGGPRSQAEDEKLHWARRLEFLAGVAGRFEVEPGAVMVEVGGTESEGFWAAFENGY